MVINIFGDSVKIIGDKGYVEGELVPKLSEKGYGELEDRKLVLSPEEIVYLVAKGTLESEESLPELMKRFQEKDPDFLMKYVVYKDLRDRGYCVKTGFKYGSHFRVYPRGGKPGTTHAVWLVHCIPEFRKLEFSEIARAVRLAQNVRKKMIFAVVDKENDITYYKIDRVVP